VLKSEVLPATQVGDSEMTFTLPIPEAAEEGVYLVAVTAVPHPSTVNPYPEQSTKTIEFYVNPAPVAQHRAAPARVELASALAE
jgi:hypothetical protein